MGNRIKWKLVPSKAVEVSDGLFCIILIDITYDRSLNCVWKKRYENEEAFGKLPSILWKI